MRSLTRRARFDCHRANAKNGRVRKFHAYIQPVTQVWCSLSHDDHHPLRLFTSLILPLTSSGFNNVALGRSKSVIPLTHVAESRRLPRHTTFTEIGVALTTFGALFMLLGVMLFFDGALLALGNVRPFLFLAAFHSPDTPFLLPPPARFYSFPDSR